MYSIIISINNGGGGGGEHYHDTCSTTFPKKKGWMLKKLPQKQTYDKRNRKRMWKVGHECGKLGGGDMHGIKVVT